MPAPEVEQSPELGVAPGAEAPENPEQDIPASTPDADEPTVEKPESAGEDTLPQGEQAETTLETEQNTTTPSTEEVAPAEEEEVAAPTETDTTPLTVTESVYRLDVMGWNLAEDPETVLNGQYDLVYAGLGKPTDFEGKDMNGKVAFIQRGELAFVDKIANAKAAGAIAVIVYNNIPGPIGVSLGMILNLSLP